MFVDVVVKFIHNLIFFSYYLNQIPKDKNDSIQPPPPCETKIPFEGFIYCYLVIFSSLKETDFNDFF